ncbi:MAG: hypothetical protein V5B44_10010 [Candidatus Accumulibacter necessarius]|uniref:hypothetical protein n=1 Tax=Candidatus Accumulibacter necessarius TaxID=2954386 RepID=UPI002FC33741
MPAILLESVDRERIAVVGRWLRVEFGRICRRTAHGQAWQGPAGVGQGVVEDAHGPA